MQVIAWMTVSEMIYNGTINLTHSLTFYRAAIANFGKRGRIASDFFIKLFNTNAIDSVNFCHGYVFFICLMLWLKCEQGHFGLSWNSFVLYVNCRYMNVYAS